MKNLWRLKRSLLKDGFKVTTKYKDLEGKEVTILGAKWSDNAIKAPFKKIKGNFAGYAKGLVNIDNEEYLCYGTELFHK